MHHVIELLWHLHVVTAHHAWWELLSIVTLRCSISSKHHLHVNIGVHVHTLSWETHLTWHHDVTGELSHVAHIHVHWSRNSLRLGRTTRHVAHLLRRTASILVPSKFFFSVSIGAFAFEFAISVYKLI